jgi:hypothetical protein
MPQRRAMSRLIAVAALTARILVSVVATAGSASAPPTAETGRRHNQRDAGELHPAAHDVLQRIPHRVRPHARPNPAGLSGSHVKSCDMHIALINERMGHHEGEGLTIKTGAGGIRELANIGWSPDRPGDSQLDAHHMTGW